MKTDTVTRKNEKKKVYESYPKASVKFAVADGCFLDCRQMLHNNKLYLVPRYINRVDCYPKKKGKGETHGWQLRYKKLSIFYSDSKYSSPRHALETAKSDLKKGYIVKEHRDCPSQKIHKKINKPKKIKLIPGVRLYMNRPKVKDKKTGEVIGMKVRHYYVEVIVPVYDQKRRVINKYFATENTISRERIKNILDLALSFRRYMEHLFEKKETELARICKFEHMTPELIAEFKPRVRYPTIKQILNDL